MEAHTYWGDRWREGRTGWHESEVNQALVGNYAAALSSEACHAERPGRILVPLCGKSIDLMWLAKQGHEVVGVEFVEEAARAFFCEQGLQPSEDFRHGTLTLRSGELSIIVADILRVDASLTARFDLLYDRGALVALGPEDRARYFGMIRSLLNDHARGLVVAFEYDPALRSGPPYSVADAEIRAGWPDAEVVRVARSDDELTSMQADALVEVCYRLRFDASASL